MTDLCADFMSPRLLPPNPPNQSRVTSFETPPEASVVAPASTSVTSTKKRKGKANADAGLSLAEQAAAKKARQAAGRAKAVETRKRNAAAR